VVPDLPDLSGPPGLAAGSRRRLRSVSTAPVRPRLAPRPDGAPAAEAEEVPTFTPVLRLDGGDPAGILAVNAHPGVAHAAVVDIGEVHPEGAAEPLTVALVDPAEIRALTPRVSATVGEVWATLARGEVLLSPELAPRLGLRAGDVLRLPGATALPVGGSASNGAPPLVGAMASRDADLDIGATTRTILVAATPGTDIPELADRLTALTGAVAAPMPAAEPATATLVGDDPGTVAALTPFIFRSGRGGRIVIDPAWERANVVRTDVPILGTVTCHRLIVPQLRAGLQALVDADLAELIDPDDYGGCYVPRHIDWNPAASLSMHAWGIAFDVNVATNALGADPRLDRRVVEVLTSHGFAWGGDWRRPDGMHFELNRLLDTAELDELAELAER
jgi:hypothetical protein